MTARRCLAPLEQDGAGELLAVVFVVKADSELARWTSSSAGKLELDVEEVAPAFVDVQHVLASLIAVERANGVTRSIRERFPRHHAAFEFTCRAETKRHAQSQGFNVRRNSIQVHDVLKHKYNGMKLTFSGSQVS